MLKGPVVAQIGELLLGRVAGGWLIGFIEIPMISSSIFRSPLVDIECLSKKYLVFRKGYRRFRIFVGLCENQVVKKNVSTSNKSNGHIGAMVIEEAGVLRSQVKCLGMSASLINRPCDVFQVVRSGVNRNRPSRYLLVSFSGAMGGGDVCSGEGLVIGLPAGPTTCSSNACIFRGSHKRHDWRQWCFGGVISTAADPASIQQFYFLKERTEPILADH